MSTAFITTVTERCRMCYACVRECPVKAIRITDGQARVIAERCIACGNCVRVCSQHAKLLRSSVEEARALIASGREVAAIVAPSFPAEFPGTGGAVLAGTIRRLGFTYVAEVSFGADLVAREYARLLGEDGRRRWISTTCPATARYVERHAPAQTEALAPIVSPMIAMARVMRKLHGPALAVVFVGPCIAKKLEAQDPEVAGEVDVVLTFGELRQMFAEDGVALGDAPARDFDPPHGGLGGLFPVSRGIVRAAGMDEDLLTGDVIATQGRRHLVEGVREFAAGDLGARLLEALCCEGCVSGPGMTSERSLFQRQAQVRAHVGARLHALDREHWEAQLTLLGDVKLRRGWRAQDQRIGTPRRETVEAILARMGKASASDELNCGACGYDSCVAHAVAIHENLAETAMCLPHTIEQLRVTLRELAAAQEALVQSEKLASMGQLAAGIAHEVNNPLGVVLMYSHLLLDECRAKLGTAAAAGGANGAGGAGGAGPALPDGAGGAGLVQDLALITEQAERCKRIVSGLLHFARQNKLSRARVTLPEVADLALRATAIPAGVTVRTVRRLADPAAELERDLMVQVLANLLSNAVGAMPHGGVITLRMSDEAQRVTFEVEDTGTGIAPEHLPRLFDPFFTTKPMGKGTGLGLSVSYGIVKLHGGDIRVVSRSDPAQGPTGTTFTVTVPRKG
ncbi:MAG: 4Fe-4S binding protein [Candidatus Eisenbacteria bacterium]|uniref:histidine kinase n=1 Tax=Eiseniibacteriota bacterium TaxID=2212470 RepID=A0A933SI01_UNCEI|nr:4Fe-4S binding protein [Candidatus Eisenbacteria bacterium]